jgi:hypothetical protein
MIRNTDRRIRSGPALAVVLLLGLLVGYPLSVGPAVMLHRRIKPSPWANVIEKFYAPLDAIPKPFRGPLEWWVGLWEF